MNENEEKMNETKWVEQIKGILNEYFEGKKPELHAETQVALPYDFMLNGFDKDWKLLPPEKTDAFKTDLLIYEEKDGTRIPRVVIEAKIKDASTHDVITYGKKATMHRALMPALRYGMMLGASKSDALTWKHFAHGSDFDFMFAFKGEVPSDDEQKSFIELVESEIKISEKLEEMLGKKGEGSDIYCVQKKLEIEENA